MTEKRIPRISPFAVARLEATIQAQALGVQGAVYMLFYGPMLMVLVGLAALPFGDLCFPLVMIGFGVVIETIASVTFLRDPVTRGQLLSPFRRALTLLKRDRST